MIRGHFRKWAACLIVAMCLMGLLPARASAWGKDGHRIVARIAAKRLTPATKTALLKLLKSDPDDREKCAKKTSLEDKLACVSTFADVVKKETGTGALHFVNIPIFANEPDRHYIASRDCPNGKCVVTAIDANRATLIKNKTTAAGATALKFIVHLVGDLHQPLHVVKDHDNDAALKENKAPGHKKVTDKGDQGGNLKFVKWLEQEKSEFGCMNLHAVWDDGIIEKKEKADAITGDKGYAELLDGKLTPEKKAELEQGTVIDWTNEALGIAVNQSYGMLPKPDVTDEVCQVEVKVGTKTKQECDKFDAMTCKNFEVHARYTLT